jgi:hypothetical protein
MTGLSAMVLMRAAYFAENAGAVLLDPKRGIHSDHRRSHDLGMLTSR